MATTMTKKVVRIAEEGNTEDDAQEQLQKQHHPKPKVVLVAVDESQESVQALRYAIDDIVQESDKIVLLHCQPLPQSYVGPAGPGFYLTPELVVATRKHQEHVSHLILERAKKICDEAKVKFETVIQSGDPRDGICESVEKVKSDLLVMGSRGHGAVKRAFLGSVSDYCVHNANCPVLIVRQGSRVSS